MDVDGSILYVEITILWYFLGFNEKNGAVTILKGAEWLAISNEMHSEV